MITRRSMLRGLFATPAIVAASSLMPIRGIVQPIWPIYLGVDVSSRGQVWLVPQLGGYMYSGELADILTRQIYRGVTA